MMSYFQNDDTDASINRYQSNWKITIALPMLHIVGINFVTILDMYLVLCTKNEFQRVTYGFSQKKRSPEKVNIKKSSFFQKGKLLVRLPLKEN